MNTAVTNSREALEKRLKVPWRRYEDMNEVMNVSENVDLLRRYLLLGRDSMYNGQAFMKALFFPSLAPYVRKFKSVIHINSLQLIC